MYYIATIAAYASYRYEFVLFTSLLNNMDIINVVKDTAIEMFNKRTTVIKNSLYLPFNYESDTLLTELYALDPKVEHSGTQRGRKSPDRDINTKDTPPRNPHT
ncbi:hypothetical protein BDF21DRAFT_402219 [Thamnidium elegans]|nr:hypothetical protein BDF21DRAFT_402219 [Thamnidium elegans]